MDGLPTALARMDVLTTVVPRVLRYFLLSHHYRSPIEYDPELLQSAAATLARLENAALRLPEEDDGETSPEVQEAEGAMLAALDDDFDTPAALAVVFGLIRAQNRRGQPAMGARRLLGEFDQIFPVLPEASAAVDSDDRIRREVDRREALRRQRRFAEADEIRRRLRARSVIVEDTSQGVRWRRAVRAVR